MELIDRKLEINELPTHLGRLRVLGETIYVRAVGVRLVRVKFSMDEYYLVFDKKCFVAKDGKGNFLNCKIIGEYL